jgi:hypothetical protein
LTSVVTSRSLNLDDLGTKIRERLANPRPGKNSSEFNDLDASVGRILHIGIPW